MAASLNDKITDVRNTARPNSARVTVARTAAGTTLSCNSLSGWPTASKVHFVTYQIDSNSDPIGNSQLDCEGIVVGGDITSLTVIDGTDGGNSVGDVVEMLPTAAWGQDLADGLTAEHSRTGLHTKVNGNTVTAGSDTVTLNAASQTLTNKTLTSPTINTPTITTPTLSGTVSGGALALNSQTLSNPYKFSAYRTGAQTPNAVAIVYNNENFDTNSNFDTTNGRYTAPVNGFYQINVMGAYAVSAAPQDPSISLRKNGNTEVTNSHFVNMYNSNSAGSVQICILVQLVAGDYLDVTGANLALDVSAAGRNVFSGFLVSQT